MYVCLKENCLPDTMMLMLIGTHRDYGSTHTVLAQVPDRWDFNTKTGKWTHGPTPNKEIVFS